MLCHKVNVISSLGKISDPDLHALAVFTETKRKCLIALFLVAGDWTNSIEALLSVSRGYPNITMPPPTLFRASAIGYEWPEI